MRTGRCATGPETSASCLAAVPCTGERACRQNNLYGIHRQYACVPVDLHARSTRLPFRSICLQVLLVSMHVRAGWRRLRCKGAICCTLHLMSDEDKT